MSRLNKSPYFFVGKRKRAATNGSFRQHSIYEAIWNGIPENKQNSIDLLQRAVELGVNFIDTADLYGPFTSEQLIGEALHQYQQNIVVGTKVAWSVSLPQWALMINMT